MISSSVFPTNVATLILLLIFTFIGVKRVGTVGEYGNGNAETPIHLSNLQCTGIESDIYQCMGDEEPTGCTHNNDVSVECLRK